MMGASQEAASGIHGRRPKHKWLGVGLLVAAAAVAALGYLVFFTDVIADDGELTESSVSPSGEWVYGLYYVDDAGAAGSAQWAVKVHAAASPQAARTVYFEEGFPPKVFWRDGYMLDVNGAAVDARAFDLSDTEPAWWRVVSGAIIGFFIVVPVAVLVLAGTAVLVRSRRREPRA